MSPVPQWIFVLSLGLFGLLFGSFANVVIWRVPRGESIVAPGSHCPSCGIAIRWHDNIPLVSYVILRARCRGCGAGISARYPLVELASGVLWVIAGISFGMTIRTIAAVFLFYMLLILAVIDIDTQRLPNVLVAMLAGGGAVGVLVSEVVHVRLAPLVGVASFGLLAHPWVAAASGVLLGAGMTGGIGLAYRLLRGRQGMGMGDIKLLGALGLFLGPYVIMTLMIASVLGAAFGLFVAWGSELGHRRIPFGPFLALGATIASLWGPAIWRSYARIVGIG